jgi:hypothetical protein
MMGKPQDLDFHDGKPWGFPFSWYFPIEDRENQSNDLDIKVDISGL